ncbi:glucose 1-dehydrogenase [Pseudonocardia eucalypti]|uniref:Glucose 1-dehydrogenase n=1 Tax=Pseudonocardia eucalypti TaxID=648755 RepID=A0ABP9QYE2_9PSEU|nr:3alpha(or 20beta)-hydroxysteroid dehydrogenase [Pseudonocardia eucalypti]
MTETSPGGATATGSAGAGNAGAGSAGAGSAAAAGRLAGKVALVTGAARGQGAAAVRRLAEEGARVLATDVTDPDGVAFLPAEQEGRVRFARLDVTSEEQWAGAIDRVIEEFGRLDVLVNNAGVLHFGTLEDTSLTDYLRVITVNQVGTFLGMRAAAKPMRETGGGSIINLSSIEGLAAAPLLTAYTASKFAIRGMTKVAALELGQHGIRVNSIHPGMIDTPMISEALGGYQPDLAPVARKLALRTIGRPEDIAAMVAFLASDDSRYCTGAEFVADGGATATHALNVTG